MGMSTKFREELVPLGKGRKEQAICGAHGQGRGPARGQERALAAACGAGREQLWEMQRPLQKQLFLFSLPNRTCIQKSAKA